MRSSRSGWMTVTISCGVPGNSVSTTALPPAVTLYLTWTSWPSLPSSLPAHSPASCLNSSKRDGLPASVAWGFLSSPAAGAATAARRTRNGRAARSIILLSFRALCPVKREPLLKSIPILHLRRIAGEHSDLDRAAAQQDRAAHGEVGGSIEGVGLNKGI